MLLLWWCPFTIQKEKRAGLQFTSRDYLSLLLTPLRIRWTIPLMQMLLAFLLFTTLLCSEGTNESLLCPKIRWKLWKKDCTHFNPIYFNMGFLNFFRVSGLLICKCARFCIKHASQNVVFSKKLPEENEEFLVLDGRVHFLVSGQWSDSPRTGFLDVRLWRRLVLFPSKIIEIFFDIHRKQLDLDKKIICGLCCWILRTVKE